MAILHKTLKVVERVREQSLPHVTEASHTNMFSNHEVPVNHRLAKAVQELIDSVENAELLINEVSFAMKHKKPPAGVALNIAMATKFEDSINGMSEGLLADIKTVRCHTPGPLKQS